MQTLFRILSRFPLPFLHALGAVMGGLVYLLSARERRRYRENLALAFPAGAPAGLAWQSALSAGRSIVELPWLWLRPIEEVVTRVHRVEGIAAVDAARAAGRPLLFLTPHLGCFEITAQYLAQRTPITVLYRPPKNPAMVPLYDSGRNRGQMRGAAADMAGVRQMLKALKQKEAVGILPDQVPQDGEGVWVPFFGKLAYTMTLAARFSQVRDVVTFFVYATRDAGGRYSFYVRPAGDLAGDDAARAAAINREIESIIRQCPDQYFWGYNRFKAPHAEAMARRDQASASGTGGAE